MADDEFEVPIRRGRGLRLSTRGATADGADTDGQAPWADEIARGRGLRLTTHTNDVAPLILRAQAPAPSGLITYHSGGEGPPLLLLHGYGASGRIWHGVMETLGGQHTCYAPDLPGFGASPPLAEAPGLNLLADAVLDFADTLSLERFDLVGHALGAAIAATIAGHHPERINRLVLTSFAVQAFAPTLTALDAARGPFDSAIDRIRPLAERLRPLTRKAILSLPAALLLGAQLFARAPEDGERWQEYLADLADADGRAYLTSLTYQGDPALKTSLRAIVAPTLLVAGCQDRIARLPDVYTAQRLIPGAESRLIDRCGHLPAIEQPADYDAIVREFLGHR